MSTLSHQGIKSGIPDGYKSEIVCEPIANTGLQTCKSKLVPIDGSSPPPEIFESKLPIIHESAEDLIKEAFEEEIEKQEERLNEVVELLPAPIIENDPVIKELNPEVIVQVQKTGSVGIASTDHPMLLKGLIPRRAK